LLYFCTEAIVISTVSYLIHMGRLDATARGLALGATSGALTGNAFLVKALVGLIGTSVSSGDWSAWTRPTPYLVIIGAAGGAISGMLFMRRGLVEQKGVFMVTICTGASITASCLSGFIVMDEMNGVPLTQVCGYWLAVAMILVGMMVVHSASGDARIEPGKADKQAPLKDANNVTTVHKRSSSNAWKTHHV